MDPVIRVREFLLDNVGHMTYPGNASYDPASQRWLVPICCRTAQGDVIVGDVELDREGHIISAPSRDEILARLERREEFLRAMSKVPDVEPEERDKL